MASNKINIKESEEAMERIKSEVAEEIGIPNYDSKDKGQLTAQENGKVGGEVTKRLVEYAEKDIAEREANGEQVHLTDLD